jgi:hypothetical protein
MKVAETLVKSADDIYNLSPTQAREVIKTLLDSE